MRSERLSRRKVLRTFFPPCGSNQSTCYVLEGKQLVSKRAAPCKNMHCKKNPVDFAVKFWQLAASAFTVNFTGACRTFAGITS